jgi:hypothetical protein
MGDIKKYEEFESNKSVNEGAIKISPTNIKFKLKEVSSAFKKLLKPGMSFGIVTTPSGHKRIAIKRGRKTLYEFSGGLRNGMVQDFVIDKSRMAKALSYIEKYIKESTNESVNEALSLDFERKFNSAMDSVDDVRTEIEMTLEDTPQLKSFYTVDAQLDKALRSYRKKIKRILSTVSESTNEAADFSRSYRKRMEGLTNQRELKSMLTAANIIIEDLIDDGFEKSEAVEFVTYKIEQDNGIRF